MIKRYKMMISVVEGTGNEHQEMSHFTCFGLARMPFVVELPDAHDDRGQATVLCHAQQAASRDQHHGGQQLFDDLKVQRPESS